MEEVRIDKWLWAARLFKARSAASEAVLGGRVHVNGERVKPSKVVRVGDTVYQTDRWSPVGDTVFPLAMFFRLATLLWLAWPLIHVATAVLYRFAFPQPSVA